MLKEKLWPNVRSGFSPHKSWIQQLHFDAFLCKPSKEIRTDLYGVKIDATLVKVVVS